MKPSIELVVFDIAGTTVQDDGAITLAFQQAMEAFGYYVKSAEVSPLMGYKKPDAIRMMLQEVESNTDRITEKLIGKIHQRFLDMMLAHYREATINPMPDAEAVFAALRAKGIRVALDTGFSRDITDEIIGRLGWLHTGLVDAVITSDEVAAGRPHPYMIQALMRQLDITDAKSVVKVGDTEVDINEGRNAGCLYTGAVTTGAFSREALIPHRPDFIIDRLSELMAVLEQPLVPA